MSENKPTAENTQENTREIKQETPAQLVQEKAEQAAAEVKNGKKKKQKKEKRKKSIQEEIYGWILVPIAAIVIAVLFRAYIAEPVYVDGNSMNNTLKDKEVVLASKLDYLIRDPQPGDIVICRYPGRVNMDKYGNEKEPFTFNISSNFELVLNDYTLFVKRLVAVPGQTVEIKGGILYVDGVAMEDPEKMGSTPADYPLYQLKEDEYFVVGDNRGNSHDSRFDGREENVNYAVNAYNSYVGPLHRSQIMGHVKCVLLPLGSIRGVN